MNTDDTLVIVGASYAGLQLASSARDLGFEGRIRMVGEEIDYPYHRPPLSKGILTGKTDKESLPLRAHDFYVDNRIELKLGKRVDKIDPAARRIYLAGETIGYDWLALTTGASCRALNVEGNSLGGVLSLRTRLDGEAIAELSESSRRVCIIGAGFIGLEVASALRSKGAQVSIIESQSRILARAFPPLMSEFLLRKHEQEGVDIKLGRAVKCLRGKHERVSAVELDNGCIISCDLVIVGIGAIPNDGLAREAGIATDNGILVDECGRTSADRVLAAGDVANILLPSWGPRDSAGRYRLESIQAANDGAKACASVIVGQPAGLATVPWFWSDQLGLKLQMAGIPHASDDIVIRGETSTDKFSLIYLRDGRIAAAHSVNKPAEHMLSRRLIAASVPLTSEQAADERFDLKNALATCLSAQPPIL